MCQYFSSVQLLSNVWLFETHGLQHGQASLSITNSRSLPKLLSIKLVMPSAISSSVIPFSFHLQSFPASGPFPVSQFFTSGGQSIGASASASVLPMNIQDWFPLGWTDLIFCPRDSQESPPAPTFKSIDSSVLSLLYGPTLTSVRDYWKKPTSNHLCILVHGSLSLFQSQKGLFCLWGPPASVF